MDITLTLTNAQLETLADLVAARARTPVSPYLTVPEAAALMRCSDQRIRDLLWQGRLVAHKDGRRTLLLRAEIIDYLGGLPTGRDLALIERRRAA